MFSWVEINEAAIHYNLQQFRKYIGKEKLLMPVIKANAYGHSFDLIAKICNSDKNVDRLCVVNSDEALRLLELKIKKPIIILSFYTNNPTELKKLINRGVVFPLYRIDQIKLLNNLGKQINKKVKIHIKVDTGTSRIGFLPQNLIKVINLIKKSSNLEVEGIFSHFASSENNLLFTKKQYATFISALNIIQKKGYNPKIKHMACTAASLAFDFKELNAIRLGLGLYGLYPEKKFIRQIKLLPALSWKTKIIQIKELPAGVGIGYGSSYHLRKASKIAILPVGYWDGYVRFFSNKAKVLIKNKLYPVRGKICMNLTMVEIPRNSKIKVGEEVILLGKGLEAEKLANWSQTINYEVVTKINPLLPRIKK